MKLTRLIRDRLLPRVRQPASYIGGEVNSVRKDFDDADVRFCIAFPDTYAVGMSHVGLQILYHVVNQLPWALCERSFCPWTDAEAVMRAEGIPQFSWESRHALADFDMVGFSLQYEMCLTNVLTMLDLAKIPLRATDRSESDPLIIGGGAVANNPEPAAVFFDLFCLGEAEIALPQVLAALREMKAAGTSRVERIVELARRFSFLYAPSLYEPIYRDGRFDGLKAKVEGLPARIEHARVFDLDAVAYPTAPIVPWTQAVHDRISIEIMRGCTRGCRFCHAGMTRRPMRMRSIDRIVEIAQKSYAATGFDEMALLSLSTSDYPGIIELIRRLEAAFEGKQFSISLPSLRVDEQLAELSEMVAKVRKSGLTVVPEAATARLRAVINKDVTEAHLTSGVLAALRAGYRRVKLYFMVGLPSETEEDVEQIAMLAKRVAELGLMARGQPVSVNASVSNFVPQPHTPFQWEPMARGEYFEQWQERLKLLVRRSTVRVRFHDVQRSLLEGLICRGDRRVGEVIESVWRSGARMDAWNEHFNATNWRTAIERCGLDAEAIVHQPLPTDHPLPWDHIYTGVERGFLLAERERSISGEMTPDCRLTKCQKCGAWCEKS